MHMLQVVRRGVERMRFGGVANGLRVAFVVGQQRGELAFDALGDVGQRRAAVVGLELDAVKDGRVVAGGEHHRALHPALDDRVRRCRRRHRARRDEHREAIATQHLRRRLREHLRQRATVIRHQHALARRLRLLQMTRQRVRHQAHIRNCEIVGDYAAPTLRAEPYLWNAHRPNRTSYRAKTRNIIRNLPLHSCSPIADNSLRWATPSENHTMRSGTCPSAN
jgi:hypothetical protein